jgi:hypothetical protein
MGILCRLGRHQAGARVRTNGGATFGRCRGCGGDLILAASGWRPVPGGYRVVWRSDPPERAADPDQLPLDLPETDWPPAGPRRIARPPAQPRARAPRTGRRLALDGRTRASA